MSTVEKNEGTGAGGTATGPKVAIAGCPAISDSAHGQLPPDDNPPIDAGSIDGAGLLDRVLEYGSRFVGYPSRLHGIAHVLWIAHTHMMGAWFSTPRLAVMSPEPGSGKSRVLEITALLVHNPILCANSSSAYLMRKVSDHTNPPTVLLDEIDAIFGPKARGNEDLRGIINSGYRRGTPVGRVSTGKGPPVAEELDIFAAVALGGLGSLPPTIESRAVKIPMRKLGRGEKVETFRPRLHEPLAIPLRDELSVWAASVIDLAKVAEPDMPEEVLTREAEIWEPLIAVADLAGGQWPALARQAAVEAVRSGKANNELPIGVQLQADIRRCFGDDEKLPTRELLVRLLSDEEAPWNDVGHRKKLDPHILAKLLKPYGVKSSTIRMPDGSTPKGYKQADFFDPWKRYLP